MQQKISKKTTSILSMLVIATLASTILVVPQASATTSWHRGGDAFISNIQSSATDVDTVPPPNQAAINALTVYWLGDVSDANYLTQPNLQAWTTTQWRGYLSIYDINTNTMAVDYGTNLYWNSGSSVHMIDYIHNNISTQVLMDNVLGASKSITMDFSGSYGTSYNTQYVELESYDYTCGDFSSMTNIHFTNVMVQPIGGSQYAPALSPYGSSCGSSTTGTGWTTIVP